MTILDMFRRLMRRPSCRCGRECRGLLFAWVSIVVAHNIIRIQYFYDYTLLRSRLSFVHSSFKAAPYCEDTGSYELPFSYTCLFWNSNFLSLLHHHLLLLSLPFEFVHCCHYSVPLLFCSPQQRILSFTTCPSSLWRHRAFIFSDKATETRTMSSSQNHSRSGSPTPLSAYDIFRLHTRSISNAEASTAWSVMGEQERSSWIDQEHAARRMGSHAYARKFLHRVPVLLSVPCPQISLHLALPSLRQSSPRHSSQRLRQAEWRTLHPLGEYPLLNWCYDLYQTTRLPGRKASMTRLG